MLTLNKHKKLKMGRTIMKATKAELFLSYCWADEQKANEIVEGEIENIDIVYQKQEDSIVAIATITVVEEIGEEQKREQIILQQNEEEV